MIKLQPYKQIIIDLDPNINSPALVKDLHTQLSHFFPNATIHKTHPAPPAPSPTLHLIVSKNKTIASNKNLHTDRLIISPTKPGKLPKKQWIQHSGPWNSSVSYTLRQWLNPEPMIETPKSDRLYLLSNTPKNWPQSETLHIHPLTPATLISHLKKAPVGIDMTNKTFLNQLVMNCINTVTNFRQKPQPFYPLHNTYDLELFSATIKP